MQLLSVDHIDFKFFNEFSSVLSEPTEEISG